MLQSGMLSLAADVDVGQSYDELEQFAMDLTEVVFSAPQT
jgi:hypothetical protein